MSIFFHKSYEMSINFTLYRRLRFLTIYSRNVGLFQIISLQEIIPSIMGIQTLGILQKFPELAILLNQALVSIQNSVHGSHSSTGVSGILFHEIHVIAYFLP